MKSMVYRYPSEVYPTRKECQDTQVKIMQAQLQTMKEDKLPFPKLLAKLRKETEKVTHGTPAQRATYEERYNRVIGYKGIDGISCVLIDQHGDGLRRGYIWYDGVLQNYRYNVLEIERKPDPPVLPVLPEPERLIVFL